MSHYDKAREAYADQRDVRASAPTPAGIGTTLMKTRAQLLQAYGFVESIEEIISGPTPSKVAGAVDAAGPSSMAGCADELEVLATGLAARLEAIRAKL